MCALRCISRFSCLQGLSLRLICCQKEFRQIVFEGSFLTDRSAFPWYCLPAHPPACLSFFSISSADAQQSSPPAHHQVLEIATQSGPTHLVVCGLKAGLSQKILQCMFSKIIILTSKSQKQSRMKFQCNQRGNWQPSTKETKVPEVSDLLNGESNDDFLFHPCNQTEGTG